MNVDVRAAAPTMIPPMRRTPSDTTAPAAARIAIVVKPGVLKLGPSPAPEVRCGRSMRRGIAACRPAPTSAAMPGASRLAPVGVINTFYTEVRPIECSRADWWPVGFWEHSA